MHGSRGRLCHPGVWFPVLTPKITQRLAEAHYHFDESDAWLDLWCHTVWQESGNAFSHMAPTVQFGKYGAILTLETLGHRWGWEKTKVWRFFKKHADAFPLQKLPGSFGCLIFNTGYPTGTTFTLPEPAQVKRILKEIRICGENTHAKGESDHERMNRWVAWYSRNVILQIPQTQATSTTEPCRVAVSNHSITRAYFSPCRHCKSFVKGCQVVRVSSPAGIEFLPRAGPKTSPSADIGGIEYGTYEGIPLW